MPSTQRPYKGYHSFDYLTPEEDYESFAMADEFGSFPSYNGLELSSAQEARAERLLDESLVIDLHDHCTLLTKDLGDYRAMTRTGRDRTAYEALAASRISAVFDNLLACSAYITSLAGWKWDDIIFDLGMRLCDIAHQDFVVVAGRTREILAAAERDLLAFVPSLEAATMIENEVDRIDVLYGLGIRQMGIAYSEANTLGSGLMERHDGGLTYFGQRCVDRMNKLGMAIDISHSGDRTSLEVIAASRAPVFITHAGARSVWPSARMKPDEVIRACAERGGVIGLEAAPHSTLSPAHPRHSLLSVMDHFEYLADLVGIEHVAFGPDTIGGDHVGLHAIERAWQGQTNVPSNAPEHPLVDHVAGLENIAEAFPNTVRWLVMHNYSDSEIKAVLGGNVMRVLDEVWI